MGLVCVSLATFRPGLGDRSSGVSATFGSCSDRASPDEAAHNQAALGSPGQFQAAPLLPLRCWIPPVRAPGQDSHLRSQRPCSAHSLGPDGPPLTARSLRLDGNEGPLTRTS
jgi:hypothetical protein